MIRKFNTQFIAPIILTLALMGVVAAPLMAQPGDLDPPGISQIVEGLMSAIGTWAVAWVANKIRKALGSSDTLFLAVIVPIIGLGVSWLVNKLGMPGNSWLVSFAMTLGSTWLDQLRVKLTDKPPSAKVAMV